ncbi:MAG: hypothetical protein U0Q11_21000 [Vicinamibacterales bacterium]
MHPQMNAERATPRNASPSRGPGVRAGVHGWRVCVCAVLMCVVLTGSARRASAADEVIDRVLAVVSGDVITLSDVRAALTLGRVQVGTAPDPVRVVLSQLIDRALLLNEVNRFAPPEPSTLAIDTAMESVIARFASPEAFDATLDRLGVDRAFVRDLLREDLRIRAYLDQRFTAQTVTEQRAMVDAWVDGLRRRADIIDQYVDAPGRSSRP